MPKVTQQTKFNKYTACLFDSLLMSKDLNNCCLIRNKMKEKNIKN